jgi:hypothetical protein
LNNVPEDFEISNDKMIKKKLVLASSRGVDKWTKKRFSTKKEPSFLLQESDSPLKFNP